MEFKPAEVIITERSIILFIIIRLIKMKLQNGLDQFESTGKDRCVVADGAL